MFVLLRAAGIELVPGVKYLAQLDAVKSRLAQPIFHLKRLPELLPQSLEPEPPEREIIEAVLGVVNRESLRGLQVEPMLERLIEQQHALVLNRVDRRHNCRE